MMRYHLEMWVPWKRFLLVMLYGLPLLSLLCAPQEEFAEAQDLPQVKIPSSVASDDGQWRMAPKDYANLRYSELDQITPENIKNLHVVFTFSTGVTQGHEAAPLVVDKTMYIVTPYPNYLYALDLTQPGAPVKWKYDPKPAAAAQGVACCDQVNRGAASANGRIFYNTLDGHTVAVDAQTGKEIWKTKLGDINKGETITMAPLVVKDKVLVGNSGGEKGGRGWGTAPSAPNGPNVWEDHNTGTAKAV